LVRFGVPAVMALIAVLALMRFPAPGRAADNENR
jgi:hypothetical protein